MRLQDAIAGLALVLSVISLLWQTWTWRSSGPRIKVSVERGNDSIFIFSLDGPTTAQDRHNKAQDRWRDHEFIVVRNRGRAAATIEKVQAGTGRSAIDLVKYIVAERSGKPPPFRLEPVSTIRWLIPVKAVIEGIRADLELRTGHEQFPSAKELKFWVTMGNGDEIGSPLFGDDPLWVRLVAPLLLAASWPRRAIRERRMRSTYW
jgi:hypothetical protein